MSVKLESSKFNFKSSLTRENKVLTVEIFYVHIAYVM